MDTEFAETGNEANPTIDLISIGIVCEDGRELYIENEDYNPAHGNEFVNTQVLPKLRGPKRSLAEISRKVEQFIGDDDMPVFWAYYADYDWVVFCWMYGGMLELPKNFPMLCMDLQQWWIQLGRPDVKPPQDKHAHHALMDARWNHKLWQNLESI